MNNIATIAKSKIGKVYEKGCSGFVCDVFGYQYKTTANFNQGQQIGVDGKDANLQPGTIVGFPGHVAIYLGEAGAKFIDCPGQNKAVRTLNSYGNQMLYRYSY